MAGGAEQERVAALLRYDVLDVPPQPDLDAIARLAAFVCGTSRAGVNLIDFDRQFQVASFGGPRGADLPRGQSMCDTVVRSADAVFTTDARLDPRFADNPNVDGRLGWVRAYAAAPLTTAEGHTVGAVCAYDSEVRELSHEQLARLDDLAAQVMALFELRRANARLRDLALRDPLTGLPNRRLLGDRLERAIRRAERRATVPVVVMIDLDGFKQVNDAEGHGRGDALLVAVADRLTGTLRAEDTVARYGGDEFVVLGEAPVPDHAEPLSARVLRAFEQPLIIDGCPRVVAASVGMATLRPGESAAALLARADARMYTDKARRRS